MVNKSDAEQIILLFRFLLVIVLTFSFLIWDIDVAKAYTEVGGPIISNTTWTIDNSPYIVIANIEVWENVILTIEPGVEVMFNSGTKLLVNGGLIAAGTASNPITFTSSNPSPSPGDWGNIDFTITSIPSTADEDGNYISGSLMQHCVVEYGGVLDFFEGVGAITGYSLLIDSCTVRYNNTRGIKVSRTDKGPSWVIKNIVYNNSAPQYYGGGGIYATMSIVNGNYVANNNASLDNGGGLYVWGSEVENNIITGNSASYEGGGIYAREIYDGPPSVVRNNTFTWNSAKRGGGVYTGLSEISDNIINNNWAKSGGGVHSYISTISDNIIANNSAEIGGGIYLNDAFEGGTVISNTIIFNSVYGDDARGSGVYNSFTAKTEILSNTIVGNTGPSTSIAGGIGVHDYSWPQIHQNNLYGNQPYDVTIHALDDIDGTLNYWGTVTSIDILSQIYDWYDDSTRGRLLYIPYLQEPDPNAPVPPPLSLQAQFTDSSANLSWDPIPSTSTGYGYKVYYDTDSHEPPYDGTGLPQGNSPIDVGNVTQYTLTGLEDGVYYISLTAYDTQGHESWYSTFEILDTLPKIYLPITLTN